MNGSHKTNWHLIRDAIDAVIDSCEALENAGYSEKDRGRVVRIADRAISIQDLLTSGWTIAEHVRYQIIRERHEKREDLRYFPETSRMLVAVVQACAELVAGGQHPAGGDAAVRMACWFREHFDSQVLGGTTQPEAKVAKSAVGMPRAI